ncbi:STAS domain-containing protein [bacterium]|nr:STAS domain-containing protein [bacterium]
MLTAKGYVDTMTCSILLNKITEILNQGLYHIVIDMAQVNYVSSAGWGVFVGEIKGIREKGGDLKIVQMTPEVYDVFEMLEFNRILSYHDSIEEAINDFDLSIGLDITKSATRRYDFETVQEPKVELVSQRPAQNESSSHGSAVIFQKPNVDLKVLPLTEKIKAAVIEDPQRGAFKIRKALKAEKYGFTRASPLMIYRILRKLNLENNEKRNRFYRSR